MNAPGGVHNKLGLSNKSETVRFFINEQDADSSIVEPELILITLILKQPRSQNISNYKTG